MINNFKIQLQNIQHINSLDYSIDLSQNRLHCLVGKNSVGKTTLIKAIQNFKDTTTLDKLSRLNIIKKDSKIIYEVDSKVYTFSPLNDDGKYILDLKEVIDSKTQKQIYVELPMPNDQRTKSYQKFKEDYKSTKAGTSTYKIQSDFATKNYIDKPKELIDILNRIYCTNKFNNLEQINIGKDIYYIQDFGDYYLREDDFSSGEYMLVQLFKLINRGCKLLVIDEIEISLDSSAQINFIDTLHNLCTKYEVNILFSTHSLAIMKKINELDEKLYYMQNNNGTTSIENHSYNFIKAELFQFRGYDRIILTEDKMLKDYLEYILLAEPMYTTYKIIVCGGADETIKIYKTNDENDIFGTNKVKIILDKDMSGKTKYTTKEYINFIPFNDIEIKCLELYRNKTIPNDTEIDKLIEKIPTDKDKSKCVMKNIISKKIKTQNELFTLINHTEEEQVQEFKNIIIKFLEISSQ